MSKKKKLFIVLLSVLGTVLVAGGIFAWTTYQTFMQTGDVSTTISSQQIQTAKEKFTVKTYQDEESGLSISYNLFLPEGYDESKEYPLLVYIADSSSVSTEATTPLMNNIGGAIWATDVEQEKHESIVLVPSYPEVILDDNDGYSMTEYVEATARLIRRFAEENAVDTSRIYGTGQSMGAMTTLNIAARHTDLYVAVLIVDGQWKIDEIAAITTVPFTYVAAGGDDKAVAGQEDVKALLDKEGIAYGTVSDLDAQADVAELNKAINAMYAKDYSQNFITWTAGSVGSLIGSEHMASFPYGYKVDAVRDWLFAQQR